MGAAGDDDTMMLTQWAPQELSVKGICEAQDAPVIEWVYDHMTTKGATGTIWEGGYSDVTRFYNHAHRQLQSPLGPRPPGVVKRPQRFPQ